MLRRPRVLHLITRLELGGAQENTLFCVRHHDRSRFEVELAAGQGGILDDEAQVIPDARVHLLPYLAHPVRPAGDLLAVLRLRALLRAREIDVLHTHSSKAGVVGRAAAALAGVRAVVHTAHGWSFNDTQAPGRRRIYVWLERLLSAWTDRIVTVSERDRRRGLELGIGRPESYALIRSGIDIAAYERPVTEPERVRQRLGIEPGQVLVGTLACLKPQKAPLDFVRAAGLAHARDARLRFVVAGDGAEREAVAALVARLGLGDVVRLLGWRRDVADLLHAMDVFALTSRFEGLPRAVLQALAAGTPVVATAVDGIPEVIQHRQTGMLVPPASPRAMAEALVELARDPALRDGCARRGRARLDGSFDIHAMVRDVEGLYLSVLEDQGTRRRAPA